MESAAASVLEAGCETVEIGAASEEVVTITVVALVDAANGSEEVVTITVVALVDAANGSTLASETPDPLELHPAKMSITITATP